MSDACWKDVARQSKDVVRWLGRNGAELQRLKQAPGLEGITLDFPVVSRFGGPKKIVVQSDRFPADLVSAAGKYGLEIELSIYE